MNITDGKKICIYCMGEYGIQTYYKLKEFGIKVDYFGDRDRNKQGYAFDRLYCISYEETLKFDKQKTIIIVAVKYPQELIQNFRNIGFENVYTKEHAIELFCEEKKTTRTPLTDIEDICQLKKIIEKCFYYKELKEDQFSIDENFTKMLLDFLKRDNFNNTI